MGRTKSAGSVPDAANLRRLGLGVEEEEETCLVTGRQLPPLMPCLGQCLLGHTICQSKFCLPQNVLGDTTVLRIPRVLRMRRTLPVQGQE